ncbi:tyrosine-type recombinase/integrase [Fluviispira vulneris]|uniref:tyrosine-type recombinase/integrase n=1 Tax=Fluviispira vulneris TaxID=2763012 RepID=UPI001647A0AA|nr:tyrosine-type recombinase/integrase [Fluviispira vulneris]
MLDIIEDTSEKKEIIGEDIYEKVIWFLSTFRSKNTRESYENDLQDFFYFCFFNLNCKIIELNQITERIILLWKYDISKLKPATVRRKLSSLSSFFNFLVKRKFYDRNIMILVKRSNVSKESKKNILTLNEVIQVINHLHSKCSEYKHKNFRLYGNWRLRYTALYTLFTVGMRVDELCLLKINSLEKIGDVWRLNMLAKGNIQHSPIIHSETAVVLMDYIKEFRSGATYDEPLLIRTQATKKLTRLSRSSIYDMVKISVKNAGISKEMSPHSCRATLASLLHQNGVPIIEIKNLLNHKLVTTTAIYLKNTNEELQAAIKKFELFD